VSFNLPGHLPRRREPGTRNLSLTKGAGAVLAGSWLATMPSGGDAELPGMGDRPAARLSG
jgi:hypothetical protein